MKSHNLGGANFGSRRSKHAHVRLDVKSAVYDAQIKRLIASSSSFGPTKAHESAERLHGLTSVTERVTPVVKSSGVRTESVSFVGSAVRSSEPRVYAVSLADPVVARLWSDVPPPRSLREAAHILAERGRRKHGSPLHRDSERLRVMQLPLMATGAGVPVPRSEARAAHIAAARSGHVSDVAQGRALLRQSATEATSVAAAEAQGWLQAAMAAAVRDAARGLALTTPSSVPAAASPPGRPSQPHGRGAVAETGNGTGSQPLRLDELTGGGVTTHRDSAVVATVEASATAIDGTQRRRSFSLRETVTESASEAASLPRGGSASSQVATAPCTTVDTRDLQLLQAQLAVARAELRASEAEKQLLVAMRPEPAVAETHCGGATPSQSSAAAGATAGVAPRHGEARQQRRSDDSEAARRLAALEDDNVRLQAEVAALATVCERLTAQRRANDSSMPAHRDSQPAGERSVTAAATEQQAAAAAEERAAARAAEAAAARAEAHAAELRLQLAHMSAAADESASVRRLLLAQVASMEAELQARHASATEHASAVATPQPLMQAYLTSSHGEAGLAAASGISASLLRLPRPSDGQGASSITLNRNRRSTSGSDLSVSGTSSAASSAYTARSSLPVLTNAVLLAATGVDGQTNSSRRGGYDVGAAESSQYLDGADAAALASRDADDDGDSILIAASSDDAAAGALDSSHGTSVSLRSPPAAAAQPQQLQPASARSGSFPLQRSGRAGLLLQRSAASASPSRALGARGQQHLQAGEATERDSEAPEISARQQSAASRGSATSARSGVSAATSGTASTVDDYVATAGSNARPAPRYSGTKPLPAPAAAVERASAPVAPAQHGAILESKAVEALAGSKEVGALAGSKAVGALAGVNGSKSSGFTVPALVAVGAHAPRGIMASVVPSRRPESTGDHHDAAGSAASAKQPAAGDKAGSRRKALAPDATTAAFATDVAPAQASAARAAGTRAARSDPLRIETGPAVAAAAGTHPATPQSPAQPNGMQLHLRSPGRLGQAAVASLSPRAAAPPSPPGRSSAPSSPSADGAVAAAASVAQSQRGRRLAVDSTGAPSSPPLRPLRVGILQEQGARAAASRVPHQMAITPPRSQAKLAFRVPPPRSFGSSASLLDLALNSPEVELLEAVVAATSRSSIGGLDSPSTGRRGAFAFSASSGDALEASASGGPKSAAAAGCADARATVRSDTLEPAAAAGAAKLEASTAGDAPSAASASSVRVHEGLVANRMRRSSWDTETASGSTAASSDHARGAASHNSPRLPVADSAAKSAEAAPPTAESKARQAQQAAPLLQRSIRSAISPGFGFAAEGADGGDTAEGFKGSALVAKGSALVAEGRVDAEAASRSTAPLRTNESKAAESKDNEKQAGSSSAVSPGFVQHCPQQLRDAASSQPSGFAKAVDSALAVETKAATPPPAAPEPSLLQKLAAVPLPPPRVRPIATQLGSHALVSAALAAKPPPLPTMGAVPAARAGSGSPSAAAVRQSMQLSSSAATAAAAAASDGASAKSSQTVLAATPPLPPRQASPIVGDTSASVTARVPALSGSAVTTLPAGLVNSARSESADSRRSSGAGVDATNGAAEAATAANAAAGVGAESAAATAGRASPLSLLRSSIVSNASGVGSSNMFSAAQSPTSTATPTTSGVGAANAASARRTTLLRSSRSSSAGRTGSAAAAAAATAAAAAAGGSSSEPRISVTAGSTGNALGDDSKAGDAVSGARAQLESTHAGGQKAADGGSGSSSSTSTSAPMPPTEAASAPAARPSPSSASTAAAAPAGMSLPEASASLPTQAVSAIGAASASSATAAPLPPPANPLRAMRRQPASTILPLSPPSAAAAFSVFAAGKGEAPTPTRIVAAAAGASSALPSPAAAVLFSGLQAPTLSTAAGGILTSTAAAAPASQPTQPQSAVRAASLTNLLMAADEPSDGASGASSAFAASPAFGSHSGGPSHVRSSSRPRRAFGQLQLGGAAQSLAGAAALGSDGAAAEPSPQPTAGQALNMALPVTSASADLAATARAPSGGAGGAALTYAGASLQRPVSPASAWGSVASGLSATAPASTSGASVPQEPVMPQEPRFQAVAAAMQQAAGPLLEAQITLRVATDRVAAVPDIALQQLAASRSISDAVAVLAGALCMLLGEAPSWRHAVALLQQPALFKARVRAVNALAVPQRSLAIIQSLVTSKGLREHAAATAAALLETADPSVPFSAAAAEAALSMWIVACCDVAAAAGLLTPAGAGAAGQGQAGGAGSLPASRRASPSAGAAPPSTLVSPLPAQSTATMTTSTTAAMAGTLQAAVAAMPGAGAQQPFIPLAMPVPAASASHGPSPSVGAAFSSALAAAAASGPMSASSTPLLPASPTKLTVTRPAASGGSGLAPLAATVAGAAVASADDATSGGSSRSLGLPKLLTELRGIHARATIAAAGSGSMSPPSPPPLLPFVERLNGGGGIAVRKVPAHSGGSSFGISFSFGGIGIGGAQPRVLKLQVRDGEDCLVWMKPAQKSPRSAVAAAPPADAAAGAGDQEASFMRVRDIVEVVAGMATRALQARGRRDRAHLYVSVVSKARTLDLECADAAQRDELLAGFRGLLGVALGQAASR